MPKTVQDLLAWREAMDLVPLVHFASKSIPENEQEGLAAEIRLAATCIPARIAHGYGMGNRRDFLRHVEKANRHLIELEQLILIAQGLGYFDECTADALLACANRVGKLLQRLMRALEAPSRRRP